MDLTARASEGLVDPVIGRDKEVRRIIQILCRRTKNNPILLGQSGVGKTAIVEGLATRISQKDVPEFLLVSLFLNEQHACLSRCMYFPMRLFGLKMAIHFISLVFT